MKCRRIGTNVRFESMPCIHHIRAVFMEVQMCCWVLHHHQPPDLKILYYELIRALLGREREDSSRPDLWEATRTVSRIEGYQGKQQISHHDETQ